MHKRRTQGSRFGSGYGTRYRAQGPASGRGGKTRGVSGNGRNSRNNSKINRVSRFEGHGIPRGPKAMNEEAVKVFQKSILRFEDEKSSFRLLVQVGEGTYGKVYKAENVHTGKLFALKKLRLEQERDGFPITSIREIKLLQELNHGNISLIEEIMVTEKNAISMVFKYSDNDLSGLLLDPSIKLTHANLKHLSKQLFVGLQYLHQQQVIHRDIKGSNLLIDNWGNLKITDFGLAKKIDSTSQQTMSNTNRVITLWYRPPELLLGATDYKYEVDCWGCGCLLLELFHGSAIFPGANELDQFTKIVQILGTPTVTDWPKMFEMPWWFMLVPQLPQVYENVLKEKFKDIPMDALDLASKLLRYDQEQRYTASDALSHPFFQNDPIPKPIVLGSQFKGSHEYEVKKQRRKEKERQ